MNTKAMAIKRVGSAAELARQLGITRQAIQNWGNHVPAHWALKVSQISGISVETLLENAPPHKGRSSSGESG